MQKIIFFGGGNEVPEENMVSLLEAYDLLEIFLENKEYVAGDDLSIADFCVATSINSFSNFVPVEESIYPRITAWMKLMEKLPYYDEANKGLEIFKGMVAAKLSQ